MQRHKIQLTRESGEKLCAEASFVPKTPKTVVKKCLTQLIHSYHPPHEGDKLELL